MERDPLGFVWRTAPGLNLGALALLLLAFPLSWIGLELVRIAVDDGIAGTAFQSSPFASFLRLQIDLPERISDAPIVLFSGIPLERFNFVLATMIALALVAVLAALLAVALRFLEGRIEARSIERLRQASLDALLSARPAAREDARQAAVLASDGLAGLTAHLGSLAITPALAGGACGLAALYALFVDWRLAAAVVVLLALMAITWPRRLNAEHQAARLRHTEGSALRRLLEDLVRRLPALQAHGTAAYERERLRQDLHQRSAPAQALGRNLTLAAGLTTLVGLLTPAFVLGLGAWLAFSNRATAGEVVATAAASGLSALALVGLARWRRDIAAVRPLFEETARTLGSLQSRGRQQSAVVLPGAGALVVRKVSAYDPASGARLSGLDLSIAFPAHVAIIGDAAAGAHAFAALVAGQLQPSSGELTFGGIEIAAADPADRARRIAFAGGDTILLGGSLRQNILYGCPEPDRPETEARLFEAVSAAGLDNAIHARGLAGAINPAREPKLAAAIVDARRAVRTALAAENLEDLVEAFDPARYNRQATIGENILFGVPLGDTFRDAHLPTQPFVKAILEAEGLTRPLTAMGLSIATSLIEIFADIPDGHPVFERFSFFSAAERGYFADLVERQGERRRGTETGRDRERLVSLALRYSENRHRLGLLNDDIEGRLLKAREAFARLLPLSLKPAIEFYDPERLCAAASLQDNLLFGRVNQERAGAETFVRRVVRRVLSDRGLDQDVMRIGLDSPVDVRGTGFAATEIAAIDVARCLVRGPDVLVIEHAVAGLTATAAETVVERLRSALIGRGLIVVLAELSQRLDMPPFDAVLRLDRGAAAVEDRRQPPATENVPHKALA